MDFFRSQDAARRRTGLLVAYYALAVALIVLAVYAAVAVVLLLGRDPREGLAQGQPPAGPFWDRVLFGQVAAGALLVIGAGTLFKVAQLATGGEAVARLLGGRLVAPGAAEPEERRLLNVVEEMAIAAGLPVPRAYVLDHEPGINAFAAGWRPGSAVVAVTRGGLQRLTRDELQGVVAHEFSHILNGDMRLNVRLIGVLHGILVIAIVGQGLLRSAGLSAGSRSRRGKGAGGAAILGLLLMLIGYMGVFFGKLIKSAVARQREFLADASAVQFTRNPAGLASALKKIGGLATGSRLVSVHAEEASHLFFSNGVGGGLMGWLATHPPLNERIRRLDPSFSPQATPPPAAPAGAPPAFEAAAFVAQVGSPDAAHLRYAARAVARLPPALAEAVRDPLGAAAAVYRLLLSHDGAVRQAQLSRIGQQAGAAALNETLRHGARLGGLAPSLRLPLAELAVASLKGLSPAQYATFRHTVEDLVRADREIDLFEFTLQRLILRHLEPAFRGAPSAPVRHTTLTPVLPACRDLLACLAYWGTDAVPAAQAAYALGMDRLDPAAGPMAPLEACGLQRVDEALTALQAVAPPLRKRVLEACAACVGADGTVTVEEAELLRAVADALDCPVPPVLAAAG